MTSQANTNEISSIIDFSKPIDEQERPKPLPEGDYVAEIVSSKAALSKTLKKYAQIEFNIDKGKYPHDYVGPEGGVKVRYMVMLEDDDQSRWSLKELFTAAGAHLPKTRVDVQDLLGRSCLITVKHGEFPAGSGRLQAEVKSVKKVA